MERAPEIKTKLIRFTTEAKERIKNFTRAANRLYESGQGGIFVFYTDPDAKKLLWKQLETMKNKREIPSINFFNTPQPALKYYKEIMSQGVERHPVTAPPNEALLDGFAIDVDSIATLQEEISIMAQRIAKNDIEVEPKLLAQYRIFRGLPQLMRRVRGPIVFVVSKDLENDFVASTVDYKEHITSYDLAVLKSM